MVKDENTNIANFNTDKKFYNLVYSDEAIRMGELPKKTFFSFFFFYFSPIRSL